MAFREPKPVPRGAFVVVLLAVTAAGIELGIPQGTMSAMLAATSMKDTAGGLLFMLHSVGSILGALAAAFVIRKLGDVGVLTLALVMTGLAWTTHALVADYTAALGLFVLGGSGHGAAIAAGSVIAVRSSGGKGTRRILYVHATVVLGMALGGLLGGYVGPINRVFFRSAVAVENAWILGFALSAALSFLCVIGLLVWVRTGAGHEGIEPLRLDALRDIARVPGAFLAIAILFLAIGAETGFGAWISHYLHEEWDVKWQVGGWALWLFFGGIAAGRLLYGWRPQRMTRARLVCLSAAAWAVLAVCLIFVSPVFALVLAAVTGVVAAPIIPFTFAMFADRCPPATVGRAGSAAMAVGAGGGLIFPLFISALGDLLGSRRIAMLTPAVLMAGVVVLAWLLMRPDRRRPAC